MINSDLYIGCHYLNKGEVFKMDGSTLAAVLTSGGEYDFEPVPVERERLLEIGFFKDGLSPPRRLYLEITDRGDSKWVLEWRENPMFGRFGLLADGGHDESGEWDLSDKYLHEVEMLIKTLSK